MTGIIQIATIGTDAGPFNLFSDVTSFSSAFETNISRGQLLTGFPSSNIPDGTSIIRVISVGNCTNYIDIEITSLCYGFVPDDFYLTDYILKSDSAYFYGYFSGYTDDSTTTTVGNIIKLNENQTVDTTFDTGTGFNQVFYDGESIKEQSDGKVIATGSFTSFNGVNANRIVRLNTNGSLDTTFIYGTGFNNFTQGTAIDTSGSILVTGLFSSYNGTSASRIIRLLSNGSVDTSFVFGTGFNNTTTDVLVSIDSTIYVLGYFSSYNGVSVSNGITRLNSDGSLQGSFNGGTGFLPYLPSNPNNMIQLPAEKQIYVAGYFTSYNGITANRIVKLTADGGIDPFANFGTGFNNVVYVIKIVWENKIYLSGEFTTYNGTNTYKNVILNPDGSIYYAFSEPSSISPYTYYHPLIIGNKIYSVIDGCYKLIYTEP